MNTVNTTVLLPSYHKYNHFSICSNESQWMGSSDSQVLLHFLVSFHQNVCDVSVLLLLLTVLLLLFYLWNKRTITIWFIYKHERHAKEENRVNVMTFICPGPIRPLLFAMHSNIWWMRIFHCAQVCRLWCILIYTCTVCRFDSPAS